MPHHMPLTLGSRAPAPTHARGSGLRPSENVLPSEELQKDKNNCIHPSSLTENHEVDDGGISNRGNGSTPSLAADLERERERQRAQAVEMLRDRGVDNCESLVADSSPQVIVRTCQWWDAKKGAEPGLLVWKIRQGGVATAPPVSKAQALRNTFNRYVTLHPVGSRLCSHAALAARKWPDDREGCAGQLMVVAASYPALEMECDVCGFEAALTPRSMKRGM